MKAFAYPKLAFINRDFKNATAVKLTLIGANLDTLALPWKTKNRNLTCNGYETEDSILKDLRKADLSGGNFIYYGCCIKSKDVKDLKEIFEQNKINKHNNLFIYNSSEIDKRLKERKFQAISIGFDDQVEFTISGLKDLVAYQNLANLISSTINTSNLFNQYNIFHFNCPIKGNVFVDFDGNIGSSFLLPKTIEKLDNLPSEEIPNATVYPTFVSLNKQTIVDSYKTKI